MNKVSELSCRHIVKACHSSKRIRETSLRLEFPRCLHSGGYFLPNLGYAYLRLERDVIVTSLHQSVTLLKLVLGLDNA